MNSHFSILPSDIIQYLSLSLNTTEIEQKPLHVLRLPHPRTGLPSLFLSMEKLPHSVPESSSTLLEIQVVSPPDERSWISGEEIITNGKLLVMTPIDPSFILLPILQATRPASGAADQFRTADDLLEESAKVLTSQNDSAKTATTQLQDILDFCSLSCTRNALRHLCDVKELSPELVVYRFSLQKVTEYICSKVAHLEKCTAFDGSRTMIRTLAKDGLMEDGREDLLQLGRRRACCDLVSQYLSSEMRDELMNCYDFKKLQIYADANMEEAIAKTTIGPKAQTKTKAGNKVIPADKKRKSAAKPSQGVEKLKKVNTTGMAKLSSFFDKT